MSAFVIISALGFLALVLEIINLRKILVPVTVLTMMGALVVTLYEYCTGYLLLADDAYNMIVNTGFSQGFSILFLVLAIFIILMSPSFYANKVDKLTDYVSVKIFMLAGAIAMVSFGHLAMFFLGLEVLSIAGYVLAASSPTNLKSNEAGLKYFIMGAFASGFIVFGIALLYGATASFDVDGILNAAMSGSIMPIWAFAGLSMIVIGLLFKVSAAPFHFWAPDVYEGSPRLVTATMSTLIKVAAMAALCRIVMLMVPFYSPAFEMVVVAVSILSMTIGNITALRQKNVKRMMAYSGISHAGFMLMGLLSVGGPGSEVLYYAAAYSLAAMAVFAVIIAVCKGKKNEDIENFNGLAKRQPLLAVVMSCALLSLAGVPVFAGFFAKFFMFSNMLYANHLGLVIFGVVNSIIALYYYFTLMNSMFMKNNSDDSNQLEVVTEYKVVAVVAIALNLLLGLCPSIIMGMAL